MAISLRESVEIGLADIMTRKVRTGVTVFGIILGVMSIMVVLAIVNGMNKSTLKWMEERGGLNKIEVHRNWGMDYKDWNLATFSLNELNLIRSLVPEAVAFTPVISSRRSDITKGTLFYESNVSGVFPDMTITDEWNAAKGRFINYYDVNNSNNVIVLGSTVAKELFSGKNPLGEYVYTSGQALKVIGIMEEKYMKMQGGWGGDNALEHMNRQAFVPLTTMIHKISPGQKVEEISVRASSPEKALELQKKLENIILNLKQGKHYFEVNSAKEQMDEMKQNGRIFTIIFVLIAVISLLVGGIVIMNIMLASVRERTREIGVRLAIGARRIDIFIQFMVQTLLITTLGGVAGIVLGYSILSLVGKYLSMELVASMSMIYAALLVSVGVGLLFGIMPAVRAGNLDPVIALRNE
jgi:putative ABC transport system permease protein